MRPTRFTTAFGADPRWVAFSGMGCTHANARSGSTGIEDLRAARESATDAAGVKPGESLSEESAAIGTVFVVSGVGVKESPCPSGGMQVESGIDIPEVVVGELADAVQTVAQRAAVNV